MTDVVVVGGGAIGLACAWELHRRGARVTVVERVPGGGGASLGNAGWITPGLAAPVPAPGVLRQAARWMLDPESPLLVRPRADLGFLRWSAAFALASRRGPHAAGTAATLALAVDAGERLDRLREQGAEFEMRSAGLLYVWREADALEHWVEAYDALRPLGFDGDVEVLDRAALAEAEPAVRAAGGLIGGRERFVRPEELLAALRGLLGASVVEGEVLALARRGAGWSVRTRDGELSADQVVVATGAWMPVLLAPLGVRMPIEAAKGYSVTLPSGSVELTRPLYLTDVKVGVTPFAGGVRLAGTLELAGLDSSVRERRVAALERGARSFVPDLPPRAGVRPWAGMRPLTPDGLPVIGELSARPGLFVAGGHSMLGITLALGTGARLAATMTGERDPVLAPFSPDRFA